MMEKETREDLKKKYYETEEYLEQAKKDYVGSAWLTVAFYIFGVWIGGIIANIIFLRMALQTKKILNRKPSGYNFLLILLCLNIIPMALLAYLIAIYLFF